MNYNLSEGTLQQRKAKLGRREWEVDPTHTVCRRLGHFGLSTLIPSEAEAHKQEAKRAE